MLFPTIIYNNLSFAATRPQEKSDANKSKKSKERQYKTASDGRLIITEDNSDEGKIVIK